MADRLRVAVLISGRGSNLQALIEACAGKDFPAEIVLVISNVTDAYGLKRAQDAGLPTAVVDHSQYPSREAFDAAMDAELKVAGAAFVCLAGFMRILSDGFVRRWQGRMINIHPSLLPAFKGTRVHEQAIAAGVRVSGCTVHFVTPALDTGPAIAQAAVPVHAGDDAESLAARVLAAEHRLYPLALRLVAEGRAMFESDRVVFRNCEAPDTILLNPNR